MYTAQDIVKAITQSVAKDIGSDRLKSIEITDWKEVENEIVPIIKIEFHNNPR